MVSGSTAPLLASGRLLVATLLLPDTISFQVPSPRDKDARLRTPTSYSSRFTSPRVVPSPVSVPPPSSLYSPALEALHGSAPMPAPSPSRVPSTPTSPGHFRMASGKGMESILLSPKPIIASKAGDRLKEFQDPHPLPQRAAAAAAPPTSSILSQPLDIMGENLVFPAAAPRRELIQPRSRRVSRTGDSYQHHSHHPLQQLSSSLQQLDASSPTPIAPTTTPTQHLQEQKSLSSPDNNGAAPSGPRQAPVITPRRGSADSAKLFADAAWTVEKAYGGNIGLQNAVHSIQDQLGEKGRQVWVGTLGMATDTLTNQTRNEIRTELGVNHSSIPVFVSDMDFEGHYHQFCKQILWPIFHYVLPDNLRSKGYEDGSWKHYVAVNQAFADTIVENYEPGDTIWVNDYHLMLVPSMIRERLPDASIGFFLHIPFPSSEIFKCLHARKEVLEGLLGADLVGFQTYSFARHFLQTCSRLLAVETSPKGIQLENTTVNVGIFPIGIDTKSLNLKRQDPEVAKWVQVLKEKYAGMKLVVARDKLDYIKGVRQKMLAFERFLIMYPEYLGKIVLIQVALSTSERNEEQCQVSDVVTRINSRFSDLSYQPIVFLHQDITFSQYLGLLTVADLCLITSLRDGMNLTSHEYVVCQEEQKNPLVLSEFAGTYGSLGACLRVNPWNYTEVATAIRDALEMEASEKTVRWNELQRHVSTNTAQFWAQGFVSELIKVHTDVQQRYSIHIPLLDMAVVLPQYQSAQRRLLLLDYDGTILPYERPTTTVRSKGRTSTDEMIKVVTKLARDPRNVVYIMSGRTRDSLEAVFGSIPNVGLCAEGGCFLRHIGKTKWEDQVQQSGGDMQWRKKVMEMFEYYKERTPGSEIEEKSVPIVWHYRQADNPNYGVWQARECQNHIEEAIGSIYPVHAVVGRKCLEVMPRNVSKGSATRAIVESLGVAMSSRSPSAISSRSPSAMSSASASTESLVLSSMKQQRQYQETSMSRCACSSSSQSSSPLSCSSLSLAAPSRNPALCPCAGPCTTTLLESAMLDGCTAVAAATAAAEQTPIDFVFCVGDDRSDEDMFQFVNGLKLGEDAQQPVVQQHRVVTCTVGSKSSEARWFVPGVGSVLQGLQLMADTETASNSSVAAQP